MSCPPASPLTVRPAPDDLPAGVAHISSPLDVIFARIISRQKDNNLPAIAVPLGPDDRPSAGDDLVLVRRDPESDLITATPATATTRADSSGRLSLVIHHADGNKIEFKSVQPWHGEPLPEDARCYAFPPVQAPAPSYVRRAVAPAGASRR